jgi:hypothetical protein
VRVPARLNLHRLTVFLDLYSRLCILLLFLLHDLSPTLPHINPLACCFDAARLQQGHLKAARRHLVCTDTFGGDELEMNGTAKSIQ